jgi:hypothetical protein
MITSAYHFNKADLHVADSLHTEGEKLVFSLPISEFGFRLFGWKDGVKVGAEECVLNGSVQLPHPIITYLVPSKSSNGA